MQERKLDDWITGYMQYTERSEPPDLYREWIAISVIASALRRKAYLKWGPMTFYPNMYIVLVGPSGKCRKGTAMSMGAEFLKELGVHVAAEAITREALIRELKESSDMDTDLGLQGTGAPTKFDMHASLTIYSQELVVFLGKRNEQLISDLTDWYDCRDKWIYRTKNMGTDDIQGVWVNLIGATTPSLIRQAFPQDAIGGGLASRIIFVFEDEKSKVVPFPFLPEEALAIKEDLIHDIHLISDLRGNWIPSKEFLNAWKDWYIKAEANPPFDGDINFDGYVQRRPNHILKLCIILAASENSTTVDKNGITRPLITESILNRAVDLLTRTELKMPRTFESYGSASNAEVTSWIMAFLAREGSTTDKKLMSVFMNHLSNEAELLEILKKLVKANYCTWKANPNNGAITITYNPKYQGGRYGNGASGTS